MTAWVDIPPLEVRADCNPCCGAVLNAIANQEARGWRVKNINRISEILKGRFSHGEVTDSITMLGNTGDLSVSAYSESGRISSPRLTPAGWSKSEVEKPIWMVWRDE